MWAHVLAFMPCNHLNVDMWLFWDIGLHRRSQRNPRLELRSSGRGSMKRKWKIPISVRLLGIYGQRLLALFQQEELLHLQRSIKPLK